MLALVSISLTLCLRFFEVGRANDEIVIKNGVLLENLGITNMIGGVVVIHLKVVDPNLAEMIRYLELNMIKLNLNKTTDLQNLKLMCRDFVQPEKNKRQKRGPANIIGEAMNYAFGVVTEQGLEIKLKKNKIKLHEMRATQKDLVNSIKFLFNKLNTTMIRTNQHEKRIRIIYLIEQVAIKCEYYRQIIEDARQGEIHLQNFDLVKIAQIIGLVKKKLGCKPCNIFRT